MKETTIILLCVAALANGGIITAARDGRQCNYDPEALKICEANYGTDNLLIAHQYCDKFYKCSNGILYAYKCAANLLYDPLKEECEWPHLVDCGDRPMSPSDNVSGESDCNGENDSGSENDTPGNDNGGSDNGSNDNGGNDNNDANDSSGDNDNDSNENNGTCNCNPGEAPSICAGEDSDGILIAHENCNQFYKCDHGKPVEFTCSPNTLYNPYIGACDWPSNVECGDRVNPEPEDDGGNDNNGDDDNSGDSDNGANDNNSNENNGSCNCNPDEAPAICASEDSNGILVAHENCNQFYKCDHGKPVEFTCSPNTLYNPYVGACDWPSNVECGDRVIPELGDDSGNDSAGNDNNGGDDNNGNNDNNGGNDNNESNDNGGDDNNSNENNGTCNCNPDEAPAICASEDSNGILVAHENCNQFYKCDHGKPVEFICSPNTLYNPYIGACDWPSNVECGDRVIPELGDDSGNDSGGNDNNGGDDNNGNNDNNGGNDNNESNDNGGDDNNSNENNGTCNCNPDEAPAICANEDSNGILVAHENCNQFYKCDHGKPVEFSCSPNTLYNPYIGACDWPSNVECGDRVIPELGDDSGNDSGGNDNNGGDDNNGNNDNNGGNDNNESNDNGGDDNNSNENNGTCNCNPDEAPAICASEDSNGILVAHENCNQFYKCDHGKPVEFICSPNTLYNPYIGACDWPSNVECGDRVIPELGDDSGNDSGGNDNNGGDDNNGNNDNNGGNDNNESNDNGGDDNNSNENNGTCNCNPDEAPAICANEDSNGILVAHENCNQFYKCDHGKPVEFSCSPNTLYNPHIGACDWPSNVKCGDRVIPELGDDSGNDSGGNDNNGGDDNNGGNDNNESNDNGGDDNNSNENNGTCNCNPDEAPVLCANEDSNGILVAHENCNQFYKCDHGKPVEFTCSPNTLYNPYIGACDWPSNVECGDRVIPELGDDSGNDSGGNDNNGGDDNNGNNDNNGGNDNNESNDNGGDDNNSNENNGTCNCNPDEAPAICANEDSNGILVAHENCNQFYKCDHGKPVEFSCSPNTLYNPYIGACDWPNNVECGDRVIPEFGDDSGNDSGGNDNNGGDDNNGNNDNNGGNDNNESNDNGGDDNNSNENNGTCNCNPDEAPAFCANEDSNGILVAHENCNQFYKCDHGKPVEFTCSPNTLYNPYIGACDWPSNVECGDRVIPELGDDSGNDSGGNDNNGGDDNNGNNDNNGGNDNNESNDIGGDDNNSNENSGTCNCNPDEAPVLCANEDSNGILVAHENCNQFYKCDHGKPVEFTCSPNTLYNPYIGACDWPSNVECGDRVIPELGDDSGNDSGGNDNNGGDDNNGNNDNNGGNDNNESNDNGGDDNNSNENNGTCNCNPDEAPAICANEDSNGILVAHENCNQFYKCDHGKPVEFSCSPNTLYNPYIGACDWPNNVECGDRVIPEFGDDSGNDSGGNDNNGGDDNNGNNDNNGGNDNNESNDNGGDDNNSNENNGTCNCNPDEAPAFCANEDSNGILVAHENCNQFYKCDHGKPVEFTCSPNTLYNPYIGACDWPSNVECGDRVIPELGDDSGNDSGGNDNNGGDDNNGNNDNNGGNDNNESNDNGSDDKNSNENNGTCNCNPDEAPIICASEDSDGILIAHENCNQFYMCAHGKPVEFTCSANTLYNPYNEACDWPRNVDCGDRVIPDDENGSENSNNYSYSSLNKHMESRYGVKEL